MTGIATGDRSAVTVPDKLVVHGADRLQGCYRVPGAKNAVLPMIAAALLTDEPCHLSNVPAIEDVEIMLELVRRLGAHVDYDRRASSVSITADNIASFEPDAEVVNEMRASFLVAGPLLSRFGEFRCVHPGGCDLGIRPVNVDVQGFQVMGATVETEQSSYIANAPPRLQGTRIYLDYPSHTGTEDLIMAACLAEGTTTIVHASREPEVLDLVQLLKSMGARIRGEGTSIIEVVGREKLHGAGHHVLPDRLVAGTFAIAATMCGGEVELADVHTEDLEPVLHKLAGVGAEIEQSDEHVTIRSNGDLRATEVQSMPHPGFPTDKQAEMGALLTQAHGESVVVERVFDRRFGYAAALQKLGADITVDGTRAVIRGPTVLHGAELTAGNDLRSGAAMILAGLVAREDTTIDGIHFIRRGYQDLAGDLVALGASIDILGSIQPRIPG